MGHRRLFYIQKLSYPYQNGLFEMVLLGLVVASLGGMIDEARICDRFDRRANSYVPMVNVDTVEEVAWKCNMDMNKKKYTDTFVAECDMMEANCFKENVVWSRRLNKNFIERNEYQRTRDTNHI